MSVPAIEVAAVNGNRRVAVRPPFDWITFDPNDKLKPEWFRPLGLVFCAHVKTPAFRFNFYGARLEPALDYNYRTRLIIVRPLQSSA